MKFLLLLVAVTLATPLASAASLPEASERKDNVIVLEAAERRSEVRGREGKTSPEQDGEPFEIIVPIARNFSSLAELFQILREDDPKEPRRATGTPPTYVKGTETNSSDWLILFSDSVAQSEGSS